MEQLELPLTQYTKLIRYKSTLGCSSDAELIGLLTQTFLCTLAQPLSISSKEVDILLTQGQEEPKIRNIVMTLLVQFLSTHSAERHTTHSPKPPQSDTDNSYSFASDNNINSSPTSISEPLVQLMRSPVPVASFEPVSQPNLEIQGCMSSCNNPDGQYVSHDMNHPIIASVPASHDTDQPITPCISVVDLSDDKMDVQGPITSIAALDDHDNITDNSLSHSNQNSPSKHNDWLNLFTDGELLEITNHLKTEDSANDEILVNKLLTVINDLVDNTEFSLTDVVDLMKSSLSSTLTESNDVTMETNDVIPTVTLARNDVITNINNVISLNNDNNILYNNNDVIGLNNDVINKNFAPNISVNNFANFNNTASPVNGYLVPTSWVPIKISQLPPQHLNQQTAPLPSPGAQLPSKHEKKENVCNTCNTRFSQFSSLLRHIRQVHQKIKDKPCPVCGERFARSQYLPNHIWRTHYNRATLHVKCLFCDAILDTKEGIQSHLWFNHVKARR